MMACSSRKKSNMYNYDDFLKGISSDEEEILPLWQRVGQRPGGKSAPPLPKKPVKKESPRKRAKTSSEDEVIPQKMRRAPPKRTTRSNSKKDKPLKQDKKYPRVLTELSNEDQLPDLHVSPEPKLRSSKVTPSSKSKTSDISKTKQEAASLSQRNRISSSSSDDELPDILPKEARNNIILAEAKKDVGNVHYRTKNYTEAIKAYGEALALRPNVTTYLTNRAACYIMVKNFKLALEDAQKAQRIDSTFIKGYLREAHCHMELGDFASCKRILEAAKKTDPTNSMVFADFTKLFHLENFYAKMEEAAEKCNYDEAIRNIDKILVNCSSCVSLRLKKAEYLSNLGRYLEAQAAADALILEDPLNADAIYIRGVSLYYQEDLDKAIANLQTVLQFAPDHQKAVNFYKKAKRFYVQKDAGNQQFRVGQLTQAYATYTDALGIDPSNFGLTAKIYYNRAIVSAKLGNNLKAIEDASQAIHLNENYVRAYLRRGKCYFDLAMFEEALMDYEVVYAKERTKEHYAFLDAAKFQLSRSRSCFKDYYKVLGVNMMSTIVEIKKAYRKQALVHHPDRHANASAELKLYQEKKFKEVGEAYKTLSDPTLRLNYDYKLKTQAFR